MAEIKIKKHKQKSLTHVMNLADSTLQNWYRANNPYQLCESCDTVKFVCMHHHIPKSRSAALRYEPLNLVFICASCHMIHHQGSDTRIAKRYRARRPLLWEDELEAQSHQIKKWKRWELQDIINRYRI